MLINSKIIFQWLALATVYFLAAMLGLSFAFEQVNTSPVWPPTGIAISALLFGGWRLLPGITIGVLLVNVLTNFPFLNGLFIALGNTLEAAVAYFLLSRFTTVKNILELEQLVKFTLIIGLSSMVSAFIGIATLFFSNLISTDLLLLLWTTWWLGDWVGGIVIIPLLYTCFNSKLEDFKIFFGWEGAVFLLVSALSISVCFSDWFTWGYKNYPLAFIYFPIAVWVGYRFGRLGCSLFIVLVSVFAIYGTLLGNGPFASHSDNEALLLLQSFMAVMMLSSLALVSSIEEYAIANNKLAKREETLREIVSQQSTDLETAAKQLKLAESVFVESDQAIMITDTDRKILRVNPAFCRISGFEESQLVGHDMRVMKSGHHDESFYRELWEQLLSTGSWQGEIWDRKKSGEVFPTWQSISAVKDENGDYVQYISIFSDITEKKNSEEKIYHLAHYDTVTGLKNRVAFYDVLEKTISHANRSNERLAVMFLDLDNFKTINDTSGHPVGDKLLKVVAEKNKRGCKRNRYCGKTRGG